MSEAQYMPPMDSRGEPMRIGLVVHTFDKGGLERGVANLANHIDRARFTPVILCLNRNGTAAEWLERTDTRIVELHKRPGNDWRLVRSLAQSLRRENLSVVHSRNWGTLLETVLARRGQPQIAHVHAEEGTIFGGSHARGMRRWINGRLMGWALRRCSAVVAVADTVRDRVAAAARFPRSRIEVIPNGVPVPKVGDRSLERQRLRTRLGIAGTSFVMASVGRLVPVKNFALAIECLHRLRERGLDVRLLLVGDGPQREALQAAARERGVGDCVHFAGEQREVGAWLAACDLYINTSLSEGMSQSLLEAMGFGLACVVTDVGDSARLVGGEPACGAVVPSRDAAALTAAVEALVRDAGKCRLHGAAAQTRYHQQYAVENMVRGFEALYVRLASARTPATVLA